MPRFIVPRSITPRYFSDRLTRPLFQMFRPGSADFAKVRPSRSVRWRPARTQKHVSVTGHLLRSFVLAPALITALVTGLITGLITGLAADRVSAEPAFWSYEWPDTDFTRTNIASWTEIMSGGPGKDGIPAIMDPEFVPVADVDVPGREPVLTVQITGYPARAYPLRYLMWHEIVNDRFGAIPVTVTFCPLCNSAIAFDGRLGGRLGGRELTFGVSGKLRNSDMVMYDHQSQSWWQQAIGRGIVGDLTDQKLTMLPSWLESLDQFRAAHPDGLVMAEPAHSRRYGVNPYASYDSLSRPFLYNSEMPPHAIPPLVRVVRVGDQAWPLTRLSEAGELREAGYVLSWQSGQASALDSGEIAQGRDVGSVRVRDSAGQDVVHDVMFAFAFHAFFPDGEWMLGDT